MTKPAIINKSRQPSTNHIIIQKVNQQLADTRKPNFLSPSHDQHSFFTLNIINRKTSQKFTCDPTPYIKQLFFCWTIKSVSNNEWNISALSTLLTFVLQQELFVETICFEGGIQVTHHVPSLMS